MSEPRFTPGPWWATEPSSVVGIAVMGPPVAMSPVLIAQVRSGSANAAIIVAAPDMLDALRRVSVAQEWADCLCESIPPAPCIKCAVIAAIDKAEGKP